MAKHQEEEYEVQYINAHKIVYPGKNKKPSLQFEIKWKGYPNSENTWEPESATEHAQDLVDQYWAIKGGGREERRKVEKILKRDVTEDEQDEDEYEEELPKTRSSNKRLASPVTTPAKKTTLSKRRKTTTTTRRATTESEDEEEVVQKSKGKRKSAAREESDEDEQEEGPDTENEEFSDSEIEKNDFRVRSSNWEKEVEKVQKVRLGSGADKRELYGVVRWRDGKFGIYKTSLLTKKIPQLLIKYYEKRLTFEQKN